VREGDDVVVTDGSVSGGDGGGYASGGYVDEAVMPPPYGRGWVV